MGISTDFHFDHLVNEAALQLRPMALVGPAAAVAPADLLGPLHGLVGDAAKRLWSGTGFNLIWRPNFGNKSGSKDFFLELNLTKESIDFTNITGSGVANRGFLQQDIALGAIAYLQEVRDAFDGSHQHFEPGVWINVPATEHPAESAAVARMGSIPHGTTINLQGFGLKSTQPDHGPLIQPSSITPFVAGSPDDGATGLVHFPEEILANVSNSRTDLARVSALTQQHLTNPNLFLTDVASKQKFLGTRVLIVQSKASRVDPTQKPPITATTTPDAGGGVDNIAFLQGPNPVAPALPASPNAFVQSASAIFWIERVIGPNGREFMQLQYTQRVLLNFNGLTWPHVSVGTLV